MKSETGRKILTFTLFVILVGLILYLSVTSERRGINEQIKVIEITGNALLSENDYLTFTKLNDSETYKKITLPAIKSRMEKHPYIKRAEVEFIGNNEVHVNLIEKKIKTVLVSDNEIFLSTDDFEILPLVPGTNISNLPVVSNLNNDELLKKNETLKTPGLVEAYKIIDAADLTDKDLSNRLSEINLRNGGDIIILFSGLKPPVIFGRRDTAKKLVSFDQLILGDSTQKEMVMNSTYIDLRFDNEIFLGNYDKTGLTE